MTSDGLGSQQEAPQRPARVSAGGVPHLHPSHVAHQKMQTADRQQHQQQQESFSSAVSSTEENVAKDWDNNNKASSLVDTTDEMESEVNGCRNVKLATIAQRKSVIILRKNGNAPSATTFLVSEPP